MKKVIYSALAVTFSIYGIAASKANINSNRASKIYKYIGVLPVSTAHQVTLTSNWTLVSAIPVYCNSTFQACAITTTIPQFTTAGGRFIPSTPIPAAQTITGPFPRFTALANTNGVHLVKSQLNSN